MLFLCKNDFKLLIFNPSPVSLSNGLVSVCLVLDCSWGYVISSYPAGLLEETALSKGSTACYRCTERFRRPVYPVGVSYKKCERIYKNGFGSYTDVCNEPSTDDYRLYIFLYLNILANKIQLRIDIKLQVQNEKTFKLSSFTTC